MEERIINSSDLHDLVDNYLRTVFGNYFSIDVYVDTISVQIKVQFRSIEFKKNGDKQIYKVIRKLRKLTHNMLGYDYFIGNSYANSTEINLMHSYIFSEE